MGVGERMNLRRVSLHLQQPYGTYLHNSGFGVNGSQKNNPGLLTRQYRVERESIPSHASV